LGYHYTNDKSRYRGITKHRMWANIRCLWVNFVRIMKHVLKNGLAAVCGKEMASFRSIGTIKNRFTVKIKEVKIRFINESFMFPKTQIFVNS
jgi:hypothetical protein